MYVYTGKHRKGEILRSPYLKDRGKTIVLRPFWLGGYQETVNIAQDFEHAFGYNKPKLVGVAMSSDSDDTKSSVTASISDLRIY